MPTSKFFIVPPLKSIYEYAARFSYMQNWNKVLPFSSPVAPVGAGGCRRRSDRAGSLLSALPFRFSFGALPPALPVAHSCACIAFLWSQTNGSNILAFLYAFYLPVAFCVKICTYPLVFCINFLPPFALLYQNQAWVQTWVHFFQNGYIGKIYLSAICLYK